MVDYTSIEDIVAGVENATQLRNGSKQDDGTDTVTGVDWFIYGGTVCSNIYANGNGWIGFGSSSEHLKVNRQDQAMWRLWREEGTLGGSIRFLRIRWSGYAYYGSTASSYLLTFDVVMFESGDIMLYVVDVPTSSYNGTFSLGSLSYEKPTTENRYVTFYLQADGSYVIDYAPISFYTKLFLVRDGSTIYTVAEGSLVAVSGEISASLFFENGVVDIPDGSLLIGLSSPEVLCWTDAPTVPVLKATVQGAPTGTHDIIGDNAIVSHDSIHGVTSIDVTASEGARFMLSFDGGDWLVYDSSSNTFVASDVGMTGAELAEIPVDVLSAAVMGSQYIRLKATIDGMETVTQVKINFDNESEV